MAATEAVADGIYRLGSDWVNWYLIVDDGITIIDCGFPGYRDQLPSVLKDLGCSLDAVGAIVLTHYHADHVGAAERIRLQTGATVYVPAGDAQGIRAGKVPLPGGMASSLWRPRMMRYMAHAARNGAAKVDRVSEFTTYHDGDVLAAASGVCAIHTPGHTAGHCSLLAEQAGVLFAGDALATVSFLNGSSGPQLLPFNEDARQARDSLSRVEPVAARKLLVGHGAPFDGSPAQAVEASQVAV